MNFKNFRFVTFIEILIIIFIYPIIKMIVSISNKALILSDTLLIESCILLIIGIIYRLYQKGDFKSSFVIFNNLTHKDIDNDKFIKNDQAKREGSFNYPLFCGLITFSIAMIIALLIS